MDNFNNFVVCDICGSNFDSNDNMFCKKCEFYNDGLKKFGRTKTSMEYQLEILKAEIDRLK